MGKEIKKNKYPLSAAKSRGSQRHTTISQYDESKSIVGSTVSSSSQSQRIKTIVSGRDPLHYYYELILSDHVVTRDHRVPVWRLSKCTVQQWVSPRYYTGEGEPNCIS